MMMRVFHDKRKQKGFTLIELLIVVAIIAILAAIAIPRFIAAQDSSRGAKVMADLRTIDSAITMAAADGLTVSAVADLVPKYMAVEPKTPVGDCKFPMSDTAVKSDSSVVYNINTDKRAYFGSDTKQTADYLAKKGS